MTAETSSDGNKKRSFIEQARRAQIIAGAIETIAEHGYANSSLARIAQHVGISKGVISYHFAGKEELMEQVVEQVYAKVVEAVAPQIMAAAGPRERVRTHITAVGAYIHSHRAQLITLSEVIQHQSGPDGKPKYGVKSNEGLYESLELYFAEGQRKGVFRHFDTRVMAVTLQAALDNAFGYWVSYPEHDLPAHVAELAEIFDRATLAD